MFSSLLSDYISFGLPLPPPTAGLVRFQESAGRGRDGRPLPPRDSLAFEVVPAIPWLGRPTLLRGASEWHPPAGLRTRPMAPTPAAADGVSLDPGDAVALAVQCHARGWDGLAGALLGRGRLAGQKSPRELLRDTASSYWFGRALHPTADRRPAARYLRVLLDRFPERATDRDRAFVRSLELAVVPGKGKPGTVEALIDALVDYNKYVGPVEVYPPGEAYWRVVERGFEAVPALIDHLGDDRLTRATMVGFNNFWPWTMRVGDVAGDILEGLAAEELPRVPKDERGGWLRLGPGHYARRGDGEDAGGGGLRRLQGCRVSPAAATAWWQKARAVGEEAYLLDRVLPAPGAIENLSVNDRQPVHSHLLRLLAAKYPRHLPALYRTVVDRRTDVDSSALAEALARGPAPAADKVAVFAAAARHKEYAHRLPALLALKDLDRGRFDALVLAAVEGLPADVPGDIVGCPEARTARVVVESDDPRVWAALEAAAKRAGVGLRLELLDQLRYPPYRLHRAERLRLLTVFLDDPEVRDRKADPRFDGPVAGSEYGRIAVRDFAAVELAKLLRIEIGVKRDRTDAEWAAVRERVRAVAEQELSNQK